MDSVFKMGEYTVTLDKLGDKFEIIPIGDVHRDTPNCDIDRWKAFIKYAKKHLKPSTVFIGTGDWNDFAAWSDRRKIRNASLHESTAESLDDTALRQCQEMMDDLEFAKNNFACVIKGNHGWEFTFGPMANKSSDDYYAEKLNCENLGDLAYLRIHVKYKSSNKAHNIDVVIHHGKAGGKLAGSTINQVDDLRSVFPNADIYIMGHDHRKVAVPVTSLYVGDRSTSRMVLKQKRQWLTRSGSFLRGYVEDRSNYIIKKVLRPTDLGIITMICSAKRDQSAGKDILTNDIHTYY